MLDDLGPWWQQQAGASRGPNNATTSARPAAGVGRGGPGYAPKVERVQLGRVNDAGPSVTSGTAIGRVNNPSARLTCIISVAFEPDAPQDVPNFNGATYELTAIRPGSSSGKEAKLHTIQAATALPHLYEMNTGVRVIQVTAALKIPLNAGGNAIRGDWVMVAEWEPGPQMCIEEYEAMTARASAYLARGLTSPLAP